MAHFRKAYFDQGFGTNTVAADRIETNGSLCTWQHTEAAIYSINKYEPHFYRFNFRSDFPKKDIDSSTLGNIIIFLLFKRFYIIV